ncbi:Na+/H+ antiporter [Nocardioides sp.]|uniref:Na+/H+ antiporter n=1 Tax=Nocardioides sp. TaxID=35761 RepID=UPI003528E97F
MEIAAVVVGLAVTVLTGAALADRLRFPAPLLLLLVGAAASYVPALPEIRLDPEVVLVGLLPPLLYAASLQTSLVDFRANQRAILLLSVGLVAFTTLGVGVVVHWLLPGVAWPVAFALGAVVAPPDAVAATAVARRIGLPRRIVTVLEGESLLNDATALVSLRTAVAAIAGGWSMAGLAGDFLLAAGGGVAVGLLAYLLCAWVRRRVHDPLVDTGVSLVVPFAAYLAAEEVHASGVLAVVVAGLLLGHQAPVLQTAPSRIAERINWRTVAFILENTVFLLLGLQASWILADVGASDLGVGRIAAVCAGTLVAVVVLRLVWVFPARYLLIRPRADHTGRVPPARNTFMIGWAGMRGVVTLAAAFVIPPDTPDRETLLLAAFTVVAGTLLIQGLTLPWFARVLDVPSPDPAADALARATLLQQASVSGMKVLAELEDDDPHQVFALIRQRVEQRNFAAWERLSTNLEADSPSDLYARTRRAMISAERARVLEIRRGGTVASDIVAQVLAMLDFEESMLDAAWKEQTSLRAGRAGETSRLGDDCVDLQAFPVADLPAELSCRECVDEGLVWVSLRQCLSCGEVGCCDSSVGQHADRHWSRTRHPVMQSAEPGEDWRWCYVHHLTG